MFVETLRYEHEQQKVDTCLDILQTETERLSQRIERLLDWGRMEAGRRVYRLHPDDIGAVLAEAITQFRSAIVGQTRQVELDVQTDLPVIWADRGALIDALLNLLTNAHKYSAPETPIKIRAFRERTYVNVEVQDQGIGIARREHHRVFEKFYRSDDRLSRSIEGSGLGLSIVKHVVQAHHGRISLKSVVGQGSIFTISLPSAEHGSSREPSEAPPRGLSSAHQEL
jgi:two-component system phosphate regulon sensor histidine kinase PhoR